MMINIKYKIKLNCRSLEAMKMNEWEREDDNEDEDEREEIP